MGLIFRQNLVWKWVYFSSLSGTSLPKSYLSSPPPPPGWWEGTYCCCGKMQDHAQSITHDSVLSASESEPTLLVCNFFNSWCQAVYCDIWGLRVLSTHTSAHDYRIMLPFAHIWLVNFVTILSQSNLTEPFILISSVKYVFFFFFNETKEDAVWQSK